VRIRLTGCDLLTLDVWGTLLRRLDDVAAAAPAPEDLEEDEAGAGAGPLALAIDVEAADTGAPTPAPAVDGQEAAVPPAPAAAP
jgi:exoribonuclease-2